MRPIEREALRKEDVKLGDRLVSVLMGRDGCGVELTVLELSDDWFCGEFGPVPWCNLGLFRKAD